MKSRSFCKLRCSCRCPCPAAAFPRRTFSAWLSKRARLTGSTMSALPEVGPTKSVGPDYRAESQKPSATVSTKVPYDNVITLPQTPQLIALLT